jgi:prevent-host-death family protein
MCVKMANMKTASVRKVQHHLSEVLRWVERGQEVGITRRNRIVARMVPAGGISSPIEWPNFLERARKTWGNRTRGKPVSRIIIEERADRL